MAGYRSPLRVGGGTLLKKLKESEKDREMESYKVILNGGSITYAPSIYGCDYCGFTDTDKGYFTLINGDLFCSLHTKEAK